MQPNRFSFLGLICLIILLTLPVVSLSKDNSVVVNIMIDVSSHPSPSPDQVNSTHKSLINLVNAIDAKRLNATYFVSNDAVQTERLYLTYLGESPRRELAMGGMNIGERLESMPYSEQSDQLDKIKKAVKACHICGGKTIDPKGFKPQSFSQNEDTYKILDKIGIVYDAGYQAGILYLPGHENDKWPYRIDNYNLYAVPVSSYSLSGEQVYLSDRYIKEEKKLSSAQWYSILAGKFDESAKNGDPMVVIFDNLISGIDADYLDTYKKFIDYATSSNATFVTTMELVNMSIAGNPLNAIQRSSGDELVKSNTTSSNCPACDALKNVTIEENTTDNKSSSATPIAMPVPKMTE